MRHPQIGLFFVQNEHVERTPPPLPGIRAQIECALELFRGHVDIDERDVGRLSVEFAARYAVILQDGEYLLDRVPQDRAVEWVVDTGFVEV